MSWGLRKPCIIQQFFQEGWEELGLPRLTEALLKVLAQPSPGSRFGSWGSSGDQSGQIVKGEGVI